LCLTRGVQECAYTDCPRVAHDTPTLRLRQAGECGEGILASVGDSSFYGNAADVDGRAQDRGRVDAGSVGDLVYGLRGSTWERRHGCISVLRSSTAGLGRAYVYAS